MTLRNRLYTVLEGDSDSAAARRFAYFISLVIAINIVAFIAESEPSFRAAYGPWLRWIETISIAIFAIEYTMRVWTSPEKPGYGGRAGRLRYMFTPMMIIDFLAFAPFLFLFIGVDLRVLRVLRLFRLLRILKLARYVKAMDDLKAVITSKRAELIISLCASMAVILIASTFMYYAESDAQPDHFGSIPKCFWWGIVTLTTVGYGDIVPITLGGRVIAGIMALIGVATIALPASILASSFVEMAKKRREEHSG